MLKMLFPSRDEPTVAVDPILRQTIWRELHKMVAQYKTTVILSTHYIQVRTNQCDQWICRNFVTLVIFESSFCYLQNFEPFLVNIFAK